MNTVEDQLATQSASSEASDELPLPRAGELVGGRYRVVRWLAGGGMGVVYEAAHEGLSRPYAIKFLRRELVDRPQSFERFQREAKLLGGMIHDHITQVFDFGRYRDRSAYIVMEHLDGKTLRAVLKKSGPLQAAFGLMVMRQISSAMAYAHRRGVVHRDLKPENLMLTSASDGSPRMKILDFGIAQQVELDSTRLTPTGTELGTYHYMSPEQARATKSLSPASDVYSLGVVFYELLSGQRPHPGESYAEVMFHLLTRPPVPLHRHLPSCPASVRAVIDRCLQTQPEERYRDAGELLQALNTVCDQPLQQSAACVPPAPELRAFEPRLPAVASSLKRTGAVLVAFVASAAAWALGGRGSGDTPDAQLDDRTEAALVSSASSAPPDARVAWHDENGASDTEAADVPRSPASAERGPLPRPKPAGSVVTPEPQFPLAERVATTESKKRTAALLAQHPTTPDAERRPDSSGPQPAPGSGLPEAEFPFVARNPYE